MEHSQANEAEYVSKDGIKFLFRSHATRRDQSDFHIAMAEGTVVKGEHITASPLKMYPWLVERFVVAWGGGSQKTGKTILDALYDQPADPAEDLLLVLGAFIFNHVVGLTMKPEDHDKKKG